MFEALSIPGVRLYTPKRFGDPRGYFMEPWSDRAFSAESLPVFVQDNEAFSAPVGTVRGLHYQTDPLAQAKLIRCLSGAILDVAVDIRRGSPAYGRHVSVALRPDTGLLYMPAGIAHGYCTLVPDTLVHYKVSAPYSPAHEGGVAWDDAALAIKWPVAPGAAIVSDRDRRQPGFADFVSPFVYDPSRS
jgi:dTDP-4-dehydrorhamnose 3,5-epimerase